jgi:hypothetical protein
MNVDVGLWFPGLALFSIIVVLTAVSLWIAGRMTPWFLQESVEPPSVRSYFLDLSADTDLTKARVFSALIAFAIMLAMPLVIAIAVRAGGIALL